MPFFLKFKAFLLIGILAALPALAQKAPSALVVIAHPDDEGAFSATLYKIANELHGTVDIFVITNGEAGYKYSTLAEPLYHLKLTDEKIGRQHLPAIRRQELLNAGKILGIRKIFFANEKDAYYGQNEREPLDTSWNVKRVNAKLDSVLAHHAYDFIFCLPPNEQTHGGHKAATILGLRAVERMPAAKRPVALTGFVTSKSDTVVRKVQGLKGYPETDVISDTALFKVNMKPGIGYQGKLNYNIVKNWEIAEHKSQGTMQLFMSRNSDFEVFWYFKINGPEHIERARKLFEQLANSVPK